MNRNAQNGKRRARAGRRVLVTVIASLASLTIAIAQNLEVDLQRAIQNETVTGDLEAAIEAYSAIVARAGRNRAVAAQALLRMARARQKLGDAESRKIYERIVKEFSDQATAVAEARASLAALGATPGPRSGRAARQLWADELVDGQGSISADGRYLSFTDWSTGDLAIRDLATGTNRRLTNTGGWIKSGDFAEFSVISPDGRAIAFSWFTDEDAAYFYDLRLMPLNGAGGSGMRVIHRRGDMTWIRPFAWTPDGRQLVVIRALKDDTAEIALIAVADGSLRPLKTVTPGEMTRGSLSPDGRYLAYDRLPSARANARDIHLLPLDGGAEAVITHPAEDMHPFWTNDGTRLLFLSDRSGTDALWMIDVADGKPMGRARLVATEVSDYPIGTSRNGNLYYIRGGGGTNVYVADVEPDLTVKQPAVLLTERHLNNNSSPAWSPDGTRVAYYSRRQRPAVGAVALVIRSASGDEREITINLRVPNIHQASVRWFPDGQSLLVVGREPERKGLSYYRIDASTGTLDRLKTTLGQGIVASQPQLGPDGRTLVYADGQNRLARLDLATGRETELVKGWFGSIALSPDGTQLAFLGNESTASHPVNQIAVMPSEGGARRVLFEASNWSDGSRFNSIGWSHDQKHVLFAKDDTGNGGNFLWRVPVGGGAPERLGVTSNPAQVRFAGRIKSPSMRPDGRQLAFSVVNDVPPELWVLENILPPAASRD